MPTYIGFSTIKANQPRTTNSKVGSAFGTGSTVVSLNPGKKYREIDVPLVLQDFVNSLNIKKGEKVGNPAYGSDIWNFIFEQNDLDTQYKIEQEITRIASLDPRLILNSVNSFVQDNGILLEVEIAVAPFNDATTLNVFFNNLTNQATIV